MDGKQSEKAQEPALKTAADGLSGRYITDEQAGAIIDALYKDLSSTSLFNDVAIGFYAAIAFLSTKNEGLRPGKLVRNARKAMAVSWPQSIVQKGIAE